MHEAVYVGWLLVLALLVVRVCQAAWYAWEDFKMRSRLREYQRTGTWTPRWWR